MFLRHVMAQSNQPSLPVVASAKFISKHTELIRLQYDVTISGVNCIAHQLSLPPDADSFDEECKRLNRLRHPNILQLFGVLYDNTGHFVVTEALNTSFDVYLASATDGPISVKVSILRDVSRGLHYLRSQTPPIVHHELIAQNVHLSFDMRAKIAVVGVSMPCDIRHIKSDIAVYLPPEALRDNGTSLCDTKNISYSSRHSDANAVCLPVRDTKWDIYSFGVLIVYTALCKLPPYKTSLIEWITLMGKYHPLYSLACKCVDDCPPGRLPIDELCHVMDTLCEKFPLQIIDILKPVLQSTELEHIGVQQKECQNQTGSSKITGWWGTLSSTISAASAKVITAVIGDTKKDHGTSVDKDMPQIICQSTMVEEDEWVKMDLSSKVHTLEDQLKLKDNQIAVYEEDFENERKDRIICKASLDRTKEELQKKEEELAGVTRQLRTSERTINELKRASRLVQSPDGQTEVDFRQKLQYKETELANYKSELESVNDKLVSMEAAFMHNKKMQNSELDRVTAELEAAKEEIAVKVAQVKQYQKQVEAFKGQAQQKNEFEQLYNEEKQSNACLMGEINQLKKSLAHATQSSSSRREGEKGISELSQPLQTYCESSASKVTADPAHSPIYHGSDDSLPPPLVMSKAFYPVSHLPQSSRPIAYPVPASQYHSVEADGMTSLMEIPFDPNLVCPICRRMFRKGEIQLYKQHVELCLNSPV